MLHKFYFAIRGVIDLFRIEISFQIEVFAALIIVFLMVLLPVSNIERAILILAITIVFSFEGLNSILEKTLDAVHPGKERRVRIIKDIAAGTVFLSSIGSVIAGVLIFMPYIALLDKKIFDFVLNFRSENFNKIFEVVTFLGNWQLILPFTILIAAFFLFLKKRTWFILILTSVAGSELISALIKNLVRRPRPEGAELIEADGFSFPSGHSVIAVAFFGTLAYIIWQSTRNHYLKKTTVYFLLLLIILIGFSRIILAVHWASDVAAGFILGLSWLGIAIIFLKDRT